MIRSFTNVLLTLFCFPLLPKSCDFSDKSSFLARLKEKRVENCIWLLLWFFAVSLGVRFFGNELLGYLVVSAFVVLFSVMVQPATAILFFLVLAFFNLAWLLWVVVAACVYITFFFLATFALQQEKVA